MRLKIGSGEPGRKQVPAPQRRPLLLLGLLISLLCLLRPRGNADSPWPLWAAVPSAPRLPRFPAPNSDKSTSPSVFHHPGKRGKARAGERVKPFRKCFEIARRDSGSPTAFRQPDLRHRRVTTCLAEGRSPTPVREAMGHADIQTTMGHTHLAREHVRSLTEAPENRSQEQGASWAEGALIRAPCVQFCAPNPETRKALCGNH